MSKDLKQIAKQLREAYAAREYSLVDDGPAGNRVEFSIGSLKIRCENQFAAVQDVAAKYDRAPRAWQKPAPLPSRSRRRA